MSDVAAHPHPRRLSPREAQRWQTFCAATQIRADRDALMVTGRRGQTRRFPLPPAPGSVVALVLSERRYGRARVATIQLRDAAGAVLGDVPEVADRRRRVWDEPDLAAVAAAAGVEFTHERTEDGREADRRHPRAPGYLALPGRDTRGLRPLLVALVLCGAALLAVVALAR